VSPIEDRLENRIGEQRAFLSWGRTELAPQVRP
jgi:hypothetical protein